MSPSSTATDFPRLTAADNFDVWKARIRASLDGKNLLGFIDQANYDGGTKDDSGDSDEDMDSAVEDDEDGDDGPADDLQGIRALALEDLGDEAKDASASDDPILMNVLPASAQVSTFASTRAKQAKAKAKARAIAKAKAKPSAQQLRRMDAKVKSFLMKTLDDKHIRIVQAFDRSYEIYQTIINRYKGTKAYGDPYGIMNFLFNARYREGDDITDFILKYEDAMNGFNTVLNISLDDTVASVFLFNAMPDSWNSEMRIWRGNREIIPYVELKSSLESHVTKKLAYERFALAKGTPESKETSTEKALLAANGTIQAVALATLATSGDHCTYCDRANHTIAACRVLVNHLRNGQVKPNTTLPANYKIPDPAMPAETFAGRGQARQTPYSRPPPRNNGQRNQGYANYGNNSRNSGRGGRGGNQGGGGYNQTRHESAMIAISGPTASTPTPAYGLTAAVTTETDPIWTIDSGCTRHVTYDDVWFTSKVPYVGSITVGGKNQIPILATGEVSLPVVDSKGQPKLLVLRNVLYAPELKFNLLSVPAAVKDDFRFAFKNRKQCAITTSQHFSIKANIADNADLYQFTAAPVAIKKSTALVANHGFA